MVRLSGDGALLGDDLLADGVEHNLGRVVQIQLLHQVGAVCFDCVHAQVQEGRRLFVGFALN